VVNSLGIKKEMNYLGTTLKFPKDNYEVLSFNPFEEKVKFERVKVFTKREYSSLIEIKTSIGKSIKVSDRHPMIVKDGEQYSVKLANELTIDDKIPVITKLPTIFKDIKIEGFFVDKNFARFMGYYLTRGTIFDKNRIEIMINREEIELLEDILYIVQSWNKKYLIKEDKIIVYDISLFGKLEKGVIPDKILFNEDTIRWELLKGLFRGDGGFSYHLKYLIFTKVLR